MLTEIRTDTLRMRKERDPLASKMVTLLSAITAAAKDDGNREATDDDAIKVIKKFLKGAEETFELTKDAGVQAEIDLYRSYLPEEMTEDDMRTAVKITIAQVEATSMKDMGRVMGTLQQAYGATMDMKVASALVREELS
jgi:uncharacterized protein